MIARDRYDRDLVPGDEVVFIGPYTDDPTTPSFVIGESGTVWSIGNARVRVRVDNPTWRGRVLSPRPETLMKTGVYTLRDV